MSIRFLRSSSLSCGVSGRGGVLGIELISDTIGELNTIFVAISDEIVLTQAYWTVDCGRLLLSCCRSRASGRFSCLLVHVTSCLLVGMQGIQASYDEYTALVKNRNWCMVGEAVKTDVVKGVM